MNLREYITGKYGRLMLALTHQEAQVFGVPYPLQTGWFAVFGDREVSPADLGSLAAKLSRIANPDSRKGARAIETLKYIRSLGIEVPPWPEVGPVVTARALKRAEKRKAKRQKLSAAKAIPVPTVNPNSDAFLMSYEWRRTRMEALKRHGAKCQCCGATPKDGVRMHVDHIKPRRLFPQLALDIDNLQVLCEVCNHGKGNWDMTDWRPQELATGN